MPPRFDYFVIYAGMRTGSNLLEETLNGLPGIRCHGELFNPVFFGKPGQAEYLGVDMAVREADPLAVIVRMREGLPALNGFRFFHDHDPRVLAATLADPRCGKIILTRNPLDSYISARIATVTGQWLITDAKDRKAAKIAFDPAGFTRHLEQIRGFQEQLLRRLQETGQTAFYIGYDDLKESAVLTGLARFLGLQAEIAVSTRLKPQNPGAAVEKVSNPAVMTEALAGVDPFCLSHVPNAEPRRPPGVPGFLAGNRVPLLFMPIQGAGGGQVEHWLRGAEDGELVSGFTQKSLRQWMQSRPGFRSFSVVSHPLLRAWRALQAVTRGDYPEVRAALEKHYAVRFPDTDDPASWRQALVKFLTFLKANLAGQTSHRIAPVWASQSTVLQGISQFALPDMILRESDLAGGLAQLCQSVGRPDLPALIVPDMASDEEKLLALATGPDVNAAARSTYTRDFTLFGFADWTPE